MRFTKRPTKARRIIKILRETAGINIKLFRNTAADDTGATHAAFFRELNARAIARCNAGRAHAT